MFDLQKPRHHFETNMLRPFALEIAAGDGRLLGVRNKKNRAG
jgi:hypothetical protein